MKSKKVMFWDDERSIGNSIIVTLSYGWQFGTDPFEPRHAEAFDTVKHAEQGVKLAIPCKCPDCSARRKYGAL